MSGTLALVGGDEFNDGCTFDQALVDAAPHRGNRPDVLVLPTGAAYEHPQRLVDRAVEWFGGLGATAAGLDVLRRPDAMDPGHAQAVGQAGFVYLVGGSPMHVRSVLKDSPVWDALVDAWHGGAVLAGSSAGAMVLCDPMVDPRGGAFTLGLSLVANLAVIPAHNHWSEDAAHRTRILSPPDLALVGIDERTALIRQPDGGWSAEGAGEVVVFKGGQPASLADLPG